MKVTFMPGIDHISGSFKTSSGKTVVYKHLATDKPGHGHMYFRKDKDYIRKKPYSKDEIRVRQNFKEKAKLACQYMAQGMTRVDAWAKAKQVLGK